MSGLVATLFGGTARAETCAATAAEVDEGLPDAWRAELERLVERTRRLGAPWACHGGRVRLVSARTGWRLVFIDPEGHEIAQEVDSPEDVVPLGEGLLARPLLADPAVPADPAAAEPSAPTPLPARPPPPSAPPQPPSAAVVSPVPPSPRPADSSPSDAGVVIGVAVGPRLLVPLDDLTLSARAHVLATPGPFLVGGWLRADGPSWALDASSSEISTLAIGPAVGVEVPVGTPTLRFALEPSLAVVIDRTGQTDAELDARIGAGADLAVPVFRALRFVAGLDAELAPARLGDGRRGGRDGDGDGRGREPDMPAATIGLRVGLEVAP